MVTSSPTPSSATTPAAAPGGVDATAAPLRVTARAFKRIGELLLNEPTASAFRVSVEGGGCSGFQYKFAVDPAQDADDIVIADAGARVVVDRVSVAYLKGSQLDYVDDLMGSSFRVTNPNATASCGCGTSFTIG